GPQADLNPHVGNFVGTVENGYRGASQVLLEALGAENADFFTVSGDLLYTRWPKGSQLAQPWAADHILQQADVYYDAWIENVAAHSGFDLSDVYTIVGDHEIGDNDWGANKRPLIPTYRQAYVDKVGNETTVAGGAYVAAPAGFEGRTYAVQRGNLLLVGLDQFETFTSTVGGSYTNVGSEMASVRVDVTGAQLAWLDNALTQANADPSINHIVVMAHAPIAGRDYVDVQATSSGLKNLTGENGPLWQTLANHNVDLYLPGEVHAVSMQMASDVLQVVTGTNIFQPTDRGGVGSIGFNLNAPVTSEQNYMVVEVYEDRIDLTIKWIETKIWGSQGGGNDPVNDEPYKNREARVAIDTAAAGFQEAGTLTIDTSRGSPVYRNPRGLFLKKWSFNATHDVDVNDDDVVDGADVIQFMAGMHTDMSGLSIHEAFAAGDVTGDFRNDYADFQLFKSVFDDLNGAGAFAAALAVPEPPPLGLMTLAATCGAVCRRSRRACVGPSRRRMTEHLIELIAP
nr:metallophosphoesterase [Pirellulales bacterium]